MIEFDYDINFKVSGACDCGDSIHATEPVEVTDHGLIYDIIPIWCMDCKRIVGMLRPDTRQVAELQEQYLHTFGSIKKFPKAKQPRKNFTYEPIILEEGGE